MAISALYSFYFFLLEKSNKIKYAFLFVSFISLCALFVNNGRSAQIAFLGTILIVFIFYFKHMLKVKYIALFSVFLIFLGAVFYYNPNRLDQFKRGYNELVNVFEKNDFNGSWGVRAYMWLAAADSIPRHPVFGAGVGDTIDELIEFGKKNPSKAANVTHLRTYHNQHLDYLTKYGIAGYILFLSGIVSLLIQLYKNKSCFFPLALMFFSMILIDSMGSTVLAMKPFHIIYILVVVMLAIASEKQLQCEERDLNPHGFTH
ncbi:MAG: O-antigen ligase family protein [Candidatus Ozemobacteraceae bacterium]